MNLLSMNDLTKKDVDEILNSAGELKARNTRGQELKGKVLALVFEKPSTRTRVSFETAIIHLGGQAIDLDYSSMQTSRGETVADTARVLSRYVDAVMCRLYKHSDLIEFAKNSSVPVINGLTDMEHPCQALADLLTIKEKGKLGKKAVFLGDCANNVANSFMLGLAHYKTPVVLACPERYPPSEEYVTLAKNNGAVVTVSHNAQEAAVGASVLYTDAWISMGFESEATERTKEFMPFQLNSGVLSKADKDAIVLHCLPAHRGMEITSDVLDGKNSVVWDQAENRMHVQKAVLLKLLGGQ